MFWRQNVMPSSAASSCSRQKIPIPFLMIRRLIELFGWLANGILWGRLDGAERIIAALLPNHPLRTQLIGEAQAQIVCETLDVMGEEERHALLAESMMRTRTRKPESNQLDDFVGRLLENSAANP